MRQLEALIRLGEALARCHCSHDILPAHVDEVGGWVWGEALARCHCSHDILPEHVDEVGGGRGGGGARCHCSHDILPAHVDEVGFVCGGGMRGRGRV